LNLKKVSYPHHPQPPSGTLPNEDLYKIIKKISNIQDRIAKISEDLFIRVGRLERGFKHQENMLVILCSDLDERLKEEERIENSIEIQ